MEVRATASSGTAYKSDNVSAIHLLSHAYIVLIQVRIQTFISVSVINHNMISISADTVVGAYNLSFTCGINRSSARRTKVHAVMKLFGFCKRIRTISVTRSHAVHIFIPNGLNRRNGKQ